MNALTLSYKAAIDALPLLGAMEERQLALQYREKQDLGAARALILGNLRFVLYIARGYYRYGLPENDLIQEGTIGLMKAVKHFDPAMGVRLISFAVHWIKAEIQEFILKNWRIVKIATTKAQRKLFFNLRRCKQKLQWFSKAETHKIAQDLGVSPQEIQKMENRLTGQDIAFDVKAPVYCLEDPTSNPAAQFEQDALETYAREHLAKGFKTLDERGRDILTSRFLQQPKATLQTLASKYGISVERVRQLEHQAIEKLKSYFFSAGIYSPSTG